MTFFSVWPFFGCVAVALLLVRLPDFAVVDPAPSPGARLMTIDGLRGFLALAVFFHHGAIYHNFLGDGRWQQNGSHFYRMLGPVGVALFFMITGFLFWGKIIDRGGMPDWVRLYIGRVFRIGPLYLAAVAAMLIIIVLTTGHIVSGPSLASQLAIWSALGIPVDQPDINGYVGTKLILAGVTWSLHYEWLFYAALVGFAVFARRGWTHLPFAVAGLVVSAVIVHFRMAGGLIPGEPYLAALFFFGMVCASLHANGIYPAVADRWTSLLAAELLVLTLSDLPGANGLPGLATLGGFFYLIASGTSLFGVLTTRPARRIGEISYGIYLLQGLALMVVFRPPAFARLALAAPELHWLLLLVAMVLLIAVATAAHVLIEYPGIRLGRRVADGLRGRSAPLAAQPLIRGRPI